MGIGNKSVVKALLSFWTRGRLATPRGHALSPLRPSPVVVICHLRVPSWQGHLLRFQPGALRIEARSIVSVGT